MTSIVQTNTSLTTVTNNKTTKNNKLGKSSRSFKAKLDMNSELYGRYNGDSPYQAANKALSEIIRNLIKKNEDTSKDITFFLVESTKGSNKKTHEYNGKRVKLDNPVSYKVSNDVTITKEYKNILKKKKKVTLKKCDKNK